MFYVDQFVYNNNMRNIHPMEKVLFALVTMGICLWTNNPLTHILVILLMLGLLYIKAGIPGHVIIKLMSIPLAFLLVGVLTIAVSVSGSSQGMLADFKAGGIYIGFTAGSIKQAGAIFFRSLSSVACLYFLALTVPMVELIYVFQKFRIPVIITELMIIIYRFIFVFIDTAFNIYTAQSSRWGYSSFKHSLNSFGILFANLWGKAFFKSQALYNSLLSRGYENEIRVLNPKYLFSLPAALTFIFIDFSLVFVSFII